ncbi:amidase signature domain-containing protein [Cercophora newfieldiana]|uniref:Amidase signature domain-containing protein n=1 Tax=Cercophora newfieldiana TaxID=92897 RepID=A0AA39YSA4_9PEZI|nr:amidase signature domain-containing protein [Cercophora newfieldiana]
MAPTNPARRFANHPGAKKASADALQYRKGADNNPILRGLPLLIASAIISRSQWIQRFLWYNGKLDQPKLAPGLDEENWRFTPNVIPLPESTAAQRMLEIGPELMEPEPLDLAGRFYSVADYHGMYSRGEVTPLQVVQALLPLIRRDVTPPSKYSVAWLQTDADAVLAAARASTERWKNKRPLGVLDGVPVGIKDDIDVEGFVSTMAMATDEKHDYFQKPAAATAWPVQKLLEAGAIMMGKMNQHEIGMDITGCNVAMGTPQNWYAKSYYTGGSSSGAASALCAGTIPIALGTDAGGSCRIPTAYCGVYGLKVTFNRLCTQKSTVCVVAPVAATVADLTIAYRVASQPNPADPNQGLFATSVPPSPSAKRYIGLCQAWLADASPDVRGVFDAAVSHLTSPSGGAYELIDIELPLLREGQLAHTAICLLEAADHARSRCPRPGNPMDLLSPSNRIAIGIGAQAPAIDMYKYAQIRQVIMSHLAYLFETYPGMMILSPTTRTAGWPIHEGDLVYGTQDANKTVANMAYVWYANMSGCPAVTCPAGYVKPIEGRDGVLPVGLMALGEWGGEEQLLGFAREVEGYLNGVYGGRKRPEDWVDVLGLATGRVEDRGRVEEKE